MGRRLLLLPPPPLLLLCLALLGSLVEGERALGSPQDPEAHLEGVALDSPPKRVKRGFTYPGTLWCGAGNIAGSYDELGEHRETDRCCRDHDNCHHVIHPFDYKYGYRNLRWHTISHCDCDNRLKACLGSVNDTSSRVVGQAFFNVIRVPCFRFAYKEQCVEPYLYVWCRNYSTVAVAVVQEQPLYEYGGKIIDGPSINRPSITTTLLPRSAAPRHQPDVSVVEVTESPVRPGDSHKNRAEKPVVITNPPVQRSGFGKNQTNKPDVVIPDPVIRPGRPCKNHPDPRVKSSRFGKKQPDGHIKVITNPAVHPGRSRKNQTDKTVVLTDSPVQPSGFSKKQPDECLVVITNAPVRPDESVVIPNPPVRPNGFDKNQPVVVTDAPVRKNRPDEDIVMITDAPVRLNRPDKKHRRGKGKKRKGKKGKGMKKKEEKTLQNVPPILLGDPVKQLEVSEPGKMGFRGSYLGEEDPFNAILSDDPGAEVIVPDPVPTVSSTMEPFRKKRKGRRRPTKKEKRPRLHPPTS